jgi:hypothetical protein
MLPYNGFGVLKHVGISHISPYLDLSGPGPDMPGPAAVVDADILPICGFGHDDGCRRRVRLGHMIVERRRPGSVPPSAYCRGGRGEVCGRHTFDDTTSRWLVVPHDDGDHYWCEECWLKRDPADREPDAGLWVRPVDW